jgi:hypothetical protein
VGAVRFSVMAQILAGSLQKREFPQYARPKSTKYRPHAQTEIDLAKPTALSSPP